MKTLSVCVAALCAATLWAGSLEELVDTRHGAVDPNGKAMSGRCLLGPCIPHGAISPGPDTLFPQNSKWKYPSPSGYHPSDEVVGFSHLHAHGTGGHPTYGLFLVSPTTGTGLQEPDLASPMKLLVTRPSYFACELTRVRTKIEISAGRQTAFYRFIFPKDARHRVVVNVSRKIGNPKGLKAGGLAIDGATVRGGGRYHDNWNPAEYDCFFAAVFDRTPVASGRDAEGKIAWFDFDADTVQMKLAISFTDARKAADYLAQEMPHWSLETVRTKAAEKWNKALGAVRAEGFADEKGRRIFYSNLYHTMIQPRDRTGDVPGWTADEPVWDDHYTLWDTWKTLYPLMSIIAPDRYASVVNSFGARLRHNGECATSYIQTKEYRTGQAGDDVDNVIADAYAKRIPGIDWKAAAAVLKFHAAERTSDYLEKGYVCSDVKHPKYCYRMASGSGTLGFAYNDWCAAQVLKGLGETELAARLEARSGNWTNVWDDTVVDAPSGYRGFVRGKASDGRWRAPDRMNRGIVGEFTPRQGFNSYFYEGTCWDYSFTVYNDIPGMIAKMGGREQFADRLEYALQNNLIEFGNEPSFMTIWMFDFVGRPDRCSFWANRLREKFERWGDGWAVPGDDDSGAMGSLYVFLTAGFFPIAGTDLYMLHGPSVKEIVFDVGNGRTFTVRARNASKENRQVKAVTLTPYGAEKGRRIETNRIRHADIVKGGVLEFEMTDGRVKLPEDAAAWDAAAAPELARLRAEAQAATEAAPKPRPGFFALTERDGRAWLVDPEGKPFFLIGCDACDWRENGYATPLTDNGKSRRLSEPLPDRQVFRSAYRGEKVSFLAAALQRKLGSGFADRQDAVVRERLRDWGFNSTGQWGWGWKLDGVPYIEDASIPSSVKCGGVVDIFHPDYTQTVERVIREQCARRRGDRDLIAYAIDNEDGWRSGVLGPILAATDVTRPGGAAKRALLAFVKGVAPKTDVDALMRQHLKPDALPAAACSVFCRIVSARHHAFLRACYRKYDPDHLFMGGAICTYLHADWIEGMLDNVDFFGFHEYSINELGWIRRLLPRLAAHRRPFALLEYSFVCERNGHAAFHALNTCRDDRSRGLCYRQYAERVAAEPQCIGLSYFLFYDQPADGRDIGGENHNFGLVSQHDEPYADMIAEVKKTNARLAAVHAGESAPFSAGPLSKLFDLKFFGVSDLRRDALPGSVSPYLVNDDKHAGLFFGHPVRVKVDESCEPPAGRHWFGTFEPPRSCQGRMTFGYVTWNLLDCRDWPVFEVSNDGRSWTAARMSKVFMADNGKFSCWRYETDFDLKAFKFLRFGVDVRNPQASWGAMLRGYGYNPR